MLRQACGVGRVDVDAKKLSPIEQESERERLGLEGVKSRVIAGGCNSTRECVDWRLDEREKQAFSLRLSRG